MSYIFISIQYNGTTELFISMHGAATQNLPPSFFVLRQKAKKTVVFRGPI